MGNRMRIAAYSDYMCPWCYVAAVRLKQIEEEFREKVDTSWKSFPLFRAETPRRYPRQHTTQSWLRAADEESSIRYHPWPDSSPLPTSSLPAQEAAKCARLQGRDAFEHLHMLLLRAFFEKNRDISSRDVLISLAVEADLDVERFISDLDSGSQRDAVLADYQEGRDDARFSGIPTVIFGGTIVLQSAVPTEMYRRAVNVLLKQER